MDYALETIYQLLVRGAVIPAAMIEMMAFWRRLARPWSRCSWPPQSSNTLSLTAKVDSSARLPRGNIR
jgi:hypothetical protein